MIGFGETPLLGLGGPLHAWGGAYNNHIQTLRDAGHKVVAPEMGPYSSNWERACELYAHLVGTVVDYGVARSSKYGHDRFGKDYTGMALLPEWTTDPNLRFHMIGYSMGIDRC